MDEERNRSVDDFLLEQVDSIPELEMLLLLWRRCPAGCTVQQLASQLYISPVQAETVISALMRRGLVLPSDSEQFRYNDFSSEQNNLMSSVEDTYRKELIRITHLIHSKASPGVLAFARAFRLRK